MSSTPKSRSKLPRKPWKSGPVAWAVATRASLVRERVESVKKRFLSLRQVAAFMGISIQPVRTWIKNGALVATGPRGQVAVEDLLEFVHWLKREARPYAMRERASRFLGKKKLRPTRFGKLYRSRFVWEKTCAVMSPVDLAGKIRCHPSLIIKAIREGYIKGRRRSPQRWEVARKDWAQSFFGTISESA